MTDEVVRIHPDGRIEPVPFPATFAGWRELLGGEPDAETEVDSEGGSIMIFDADHLRAEHNATASKLRDGTPTGGVVVHVTGAGVRKWLNQVKAARREAAGR